MKPLSNSNSPLKNRNVYPIVKSIKMAPLQKPVLKNQKTQKSHSPKTQNFKNLAKNSGKSHISEEKSICELISQLQQKIQNKISVEIPLNSEKEKLRSFNNSKVIMMKSLNFLTTLRDELVEQNFHQQSLQKSQEFETFKNSKSFQKESFVDKFFENQTSHNLQIHENLPFNFEENGKIKSQNLNFEVPLKNHKEIDPYLNKNNIFDNEDSQSAVSNNELNEVLSKMIKRQKNLELENQEIRSENEDLIGKLKSKTKRIIELEKMVDDLQKIIPKEKVKKTSDLVFAKIKSEYQFGNYAYIHKEKY